MCIPCRVEKGDAMQLYQFIIKVVPNHALERTYFIALAAKHEQEVSSHASGLISHALSSNLSC